MHALSQLHSGADGGATGGGFDESAVRLRRGVAQRRPARDQGVCRSGDENLSTRGAQGPGRVLPVGTAARGSLAQSLRRLCGTRALRTRADCTSRRGRPRSRTRHAHTRAHTRHACTHARSPKTRARVIAAALFATLPPAGFSQKVKRKARLTHGVGRQSRLPRLGWGGGGPRGGGTFRGR